MKNIILCAIVILWQFSYSQVTKIRIQPGPSSGLDADITNLPCKGYYICDTSCTANEQLMQANAWTWSGTPAVKRAFLKFDLTSYPYNPAKLISAKLFLYFPTQFLAYESNSTLSGSNALNIDRVTQSWQPVSLRNANQPSTVITGLTNPANRVTTQATTSPTENFEIDITEMVRYWLSNPNSNFGMRFSLQNEMNYRRVSFATSNYPDSLLRPKLELSFNSSEGIDHNTRIKPFIITNPSNGKINFPFATGSFSSLVISDNLGRTIHAMNEISVDEINALNIMLPKGVYFITIRSSEYNGTQKLIVL